MRQLSELKTKLEEKETVDQARYEAMSKKKKEYTPFKADWRGFGEWMEETKNREGKSHERQVKTNQPIQCVK